MQQAISAGHQETLNTAKEILLAGGNAFDAAVAAHLTMFIAEPCMASAGGGGFALIYQPNKGVNFVDFFCHTPRVKRKIENLDFFPIRVDFGNDSEEFHIGAGSVAVPGTIAGLFHLQENYGTMPFRELSAIPISLAKSGVAVDTFQAYDFGLLEPILTYTAEGRSIFTQNDKLRKEGDLLQLPMMADFLGFLSDEGKEGFYQGEIGRLIAKSNQENGGFLSREDFEKFKINSTPPLRSKLKNYTLYSANRPSIGGVILANYITGIKKQRSPQVIKRLVENLLDISYQVSEFDQNNGTKLNGSWGFDTVKKGTSHFNILDKWGNAISLTTSIGEGNGTFIEGTQMQLNNMLGELFLLPNGVHSWTENTRLNSMMAPTMILNGEQLQLVLGSGGASRIPFAIGQTLRSIFIDKLELSAAINAPRIHYHESKLQAEFIKAFLEAPTGPYKIWNQNHMFFGGVNAISAMANNTQAYADPRRYGVAEVF